METKLQQRSREYKESNENFRIEKCNNQNLNVLYRLNIRMERTEERTSKLEDGSIKIIQSEQHTEREKKRHRRKKEHCFGYLGDKKS